MTSEPTPSQRMDDALAKLKSDMEHEARLLADAGWRKRVRRLEAEIRRVENCAGGSDAWSSRVRHVELTTLRRALAIMKGSES